MHILHAHLFDPTAPQGRRGLQRLVRLTTADVVGFPFFLLWQPSIC
jgi:hypothetical protein